VSEQPNISARELEGWFVDAIESCTDYQSKPDREVSLIWMLLDHVKAVGAARASGQPEPLMPLDVWCEQLENASKGSPNEAALAEYARNDIIRREVEIRVREELARIRREGGGA
jgi:hypothetical protein